MEDDKQPRVVHGAKPKRNVSIMDFIFFAALLIVIGALAFTLFSKLSLKHDVSNARAVSDAVIADIAKRDGAAALALGTTKFKHDNTAKQLTERFNAIKPVTKTKTEVFRQTFANSKSGDTVFVIYKYPAQLPFYLRIAVQKESGQWRLTNIAGNGDVSQLVVN